MVNNQTEFNNKYKTKEVKEIKIKDEYDFQGQLVITDYSNLEKLYLHDIDSVDKVTLKNLPQLQKCTIWDCGLKELVIEKCETTVTFRLDIIFCKKQTIQNQIVWSSYYTYIYVEIFG